MVLVVSAGTRLFLCDVAFGKVGLVNPVPLDSANTGPFNGGHFRLKLERQTCRSRHSFQYDNYFLWYTEETDSETSTWTRGYSFVPVQDYDFMDALPCNLQVHGYFESPFTQRLWCEKRSLEDHVRILGKHFLQKTSREMVQRDIDTAEQLQALLLQHFRLSISKGMCQHMLGVGTAAASEDKWSRLVAARAGAGSADSPARIVLGIAFSLAALALVGWMKRSPAMADANELLPLHKRLPAGCSDAELQETLRFSLKRWQRQPRIATTTLQDVAWKVDPGLSLRILSCMAQSRFPLDVFHCNAVATSLAKRGCWRECCDLLDRMSTFRVLPDAVSATASLVAIEKQSVWPAAVQLMSSLSQHEVQPDTIVANAAMRAVQSGGEWQQVLSLFRGSVEASMLPDKVGYNIVVCSFEEHRMWEQALAMLHEMPAALVTPDVANWNAAMNVCCKATQWQRTVGLLHSIPPKLRASRTSHNVAIHACELGSQWDVALQLLAAMTDTDEASFSSTLAACATTGSWQAALDIMGYMVRSRKEPRDFDRAAAIRACSVGQRVDLSLELLEATLRSRAARGRLCYDAAMQECSRSKLWQQCLQLLHDMPHYSLSPTSASYDTVINSCENSGKWHLALCLLGVMPARAVMPDLWNFYSAVGVCAHAGQWQAVLRLLLVLPPDARPDAGIFKHAILGCDDACKWEAALALLGNMPAAKVVPDGGCFDAAIGACARVGQWLLALSVFEEAMFVGKATASSLNFMLTACRTGGEWELALQLFRQLSFEPDLDCFRAVASSCQLQAAWRESLAFLEEMPRRRLGPDFVSTATVGDACERAGEWQIGLGLLVQFLHSGEAQDVLAPCLAQAMSTCCLGFCWQGAISLLLRCDTQDIQDWNFVMTTCRRSEQWQATLALFRALLDQRLQPDGTEGKKGKQLGERAACTSRPDCS
ncbi:unnamed protein product [Symbiodinium necroappetens]|uniref:Pentatricopeptide repeat-containing protein, chloroplastic n=1 Tax=Symbiodinium necroappetens TaxID=1628268 RepID=A0A812JJZ4_9DINO|nr:unnamed protein product [Symbiodinium necroappetens]